MMSLMFTPSNPQTIIPALPFEVSHWRCFIGQPIPTDLFDKNGGHLWGWRTPACFTNEALQEIHSLQNNCIADQ